MPVTPLMFAAALLVAALLPQYELRVFDGPWRSSPREALVDFTISHGAAAEACACLPGFIVVSGEDDDFGDE